METETHLQLAIDGGIATLTLRRPVKLNALDEALIEELAAACRTI